MRRAFLLSLLLASLLPHAAHAGYTHYWKWLEPPPKEALEKCIAEMARVLAAERGSVAGQTGKWQPTIEKYAIEFNGVGAMAYEPFTFPNKIGFNFCKTQWRPYDRTVTACLLIARDYFSQDILQIGSDGEWSDWDSGARLYADTTGRAARSPFTDMKKMFENAKKHPPPAPDATDDTGDPDDADDDAQNKPRVRTPKNDNSLLLAIPLVVVIAVVFVIWRRDAR